MLVSKEEWPVQHIKRLLYGHLLRQAFVRLHHFSFVFILQLIYCNYTRCHRNLVETLQQPIRTTQKTLVLSIFKD
ncbi:hypothetical protein BX070DRAFT_227154 [Coemansia spiralis]|nr:hypothetical protein BX070DRAFT_227154 [Coemansia spiralis]